MAAGGDRVLLEGVIARGGRASMAVALVMSGSRERSRSIRDESACLRRSESRCQSVGMVRRVYGLYDDEQSGRRET